MADLPEYLDRFKPTYPRGMSRAPAEDPGFNTTPVMDQPPTPAAMPRLSNASSAGVAGVYKVAGPDGSVTYTDRPGGSFAANDQRKAVPRANPGLVNNALYGPGVQTQVGEVGTGTGNFSANELAGTGAKFKYQPPTGEGDSTGDLRKLAAGSPEWVAANNEHIDPLASQDAAEQFARNQRSVNDFRRGDGRFNRTMYDPSGYAQQQAFPGGMGQMGGLDAISTLSKIRTADRRENRRDAEFAASQEEKAQGRAEKTQDRYRDSFKDSGIAPDAQGRLSSVLSLPELFKSNPKYLQSEAGQRGVNQLFEYLNRLMRPNGVAPGGYPQTFAPGDRVTVEGQGPMSRRWTGSNFTVAGDYAKPGPNGTWVPATKDEAGAVRNEYVGDRHIVPNMLPGIASLANFPMDNRQLNVDNDPELKALIGEHGESLKAFEPIFDALYQQATEQRRAGMPRQ